MSQTVSNPSMLGKGVYSIPEAARLVGMTSGRLRTWFTGRAGRQRPFFESDHARQDGDLAISFRDLIDAYVAIQFRDQRWGDRRLSLESLRTMFRNAQRHFRTKHGFCHRELLADPHGHLVTFVEDEDGRRKLVDLLNNQLLMEGVLLPFLRKLDYAEELQLAERWRIAEGVVIDPQINFGKPIVVGSGISTYVLAKAFEGNDRNADVVASWWDVPREHVLAAVDFEARLRQRHVA